MTVRNNNHVWCPNLNRCEFSCSIWASSTIDPMFSLSCILGLSKIQHRLPGKKCAAWARNKNKTHHEIQNYSRDCCKLFFVIRGCIKCMLWLCRQPNIMSELNYFHYLLKGRYLLPLSIGTIHLLIYSCTYFVDQTPPQNCPLGTQCRNNSCIFPVNEGGSSKSIISMKGENICRNSLDGAQVCINPQSFTVCIGGGNVMW